MAKPFKVFGIGLNKTGTSSLKLALRRLGFDHSRRKMSFSREYFRGNMDVVFEEAETHESFEDWPWPLVYKDMFAKYGSEARYVLTTRISADVWLKSIKTHAERVRGREIRRKIYGYPFPHGVEENYIAYYENHNAEVRRFFAENNATHLLSDLCWEKGHGWLELCTFLGEPLRATEFPHSNSRADSDPDEGLALENRQLINKQLQDINGAS